MQEHFMSLAKRSINNWPLFTDIDIDLLKFVWPAIFTFCFCLQKRFLQSAKQWPPYLEMLYYQRNDFYAIPEDSKGIFANPCGDWHVDILNETKQTPTLICHVCSTPYCFIVSETAPEPRNVLQRRLPHKWFLSAEKKLPILF